MRAGGAAAIPSDLTPLTSSAGAPTRTSAQVAISDDLALPYTSWLRYDEFALGLPDHCLAEPRRAWASLARHRGRLPAMRRAAEAVRGLFLLERQEALAAVLTSVLIEQSRRISALRRLMRARDGAAQLALAAKGSSSKPKRAASLRWVRRHNGTLSS